MVTSFADIAFHELLHNLQQWINGQTGLREPRLILLYLSITDGKPDSRKLSSDKLVR